VEGFKYIKNYVSGGQGTILVYGIIGNNIDKRGNITYGINGTDFATEMLFLEQTCNDIEVRICSEGGGVLDGYKMASSIYNCKIPVTTVINGLAASTALWCAAAAPVGNRKAMDFSSGMIHESSGASDDVVKNIIDNSINTMLTNRCNLKTEDIKSMMEQETWLDCKDMIKYGFIDKIVSTDKTVTRSNNLAEMATIYNKLINNESEMDNAQIEAMKAENQNLKATNETLKQRVEALEAAENAAKLEAKNKLKTDATALGNKAFEEGRITKEEVESTIENASKDETNFKMVSNFLSKLPTKKTSQKPFNINNVTDVENKEDRANWNYNDWEEKDEAGLKNMYVNNRAEFDELLKTRVVKTKK
jgi:ATP-dependent protease ClpP protease subunit